MNPDRPEGRIVASPGEYFAIVLNGRWRIVNTRNEALTVDLPDEHQHIADEAWAAMSRLDDVYAALLSAR